MRVLRFGLADMCIDQFQHLFEQIGAPVQIADDIDRAARDRAARIAALWRGSGVRRAPEQRGKAAFHAP